MPLTPGERLDLKRHIASALSAQDWSAIDETLAEFGLATGYATNDESRQEYILRMLGKAGEQEEEVLKQLDSYLYPETAPSADAEPDAFDDPANPWRGIGFRLFISHIHENALEAGALRDELAKRSVDAFVAHDSINPTEEWVEVIEYALRSCEACVALLTPGFKESDWTDQEVGACVARRLLVIPVEYGLNPYGFLARYQALPVAGRDQSELALAIFELLAQKEQRRGAMARALVARWAESNSFDAARANYGVLRKVPAEAWTRQLVDEVWAARERNVDLRNANINWEPSADAVRRLFEGLPYTGGPPGP
jgi:hypothetical protein